MKTHQEQKKEFPQTELIANHCCAVTVFLDMSVHDAILKLYYWAFEDRKTERQKERKKEERKKEERKNVIGKIQLTDR